MTRIIAKVPNSKLQHPEKFQSPSSRQTGYRASRGLMFDVWCFSGASMLDVGASLQRLHFDRKRWRQIVDDCLPTISRIGRCINLPASRSEVNAARLERIDRPLIAQPVDVAIALPRHLGH